MWIWWVVPFVQKEWITKENKISLESGKNWWRHHVANQNYINRNVFIGSLYDMLVLFGRSSEQKLYSKMIRQYGHLKIQWICHYRDLPSLPPNVMKTFQWLWNRFACILFCYRTSRFSGPFCFHLNGLFANNRCIMKRKHVIMCFIFLFRQCTTCKVKGICPLDVSALDSLYFKHRCLIQ